MQLKKEELLPAITSLEIIDAVCRKTKSTPNLVMIGHFAKYFFQASIVYRNRVRPPTIICEAFDIEKSV